MELSWAELSCARVEVGTDLEQLPAPAPLLTVAAASAVHCEYSTVYCVLCGGVLCIAQCTHRHTTEYTEISCLCVFGVSGLCTLLYVCVSVCKLICLVCSTVAQHRVVG